MLINWGYGMQEQEPALNNPEAIAGQSLHGLIKWAIETIPEPVGLSSDPYELPENAVTLIPQRTSYYEDGRISFGGEYDIRRVRIKKDYELIFTSNKNYDSTTLIVHQFTPDGGLNARILFSQPKGKDEIGKNWEGEGFGGVLDISRKRFHRKLEQEESVALKLTIVGAVHGLPVKEVLDELKEVLNELTAVSPAEQRLIDANYTEPKQEREYDTGITELDPARVKVPKKLHGVSSR